MGLIPHRQGRLQQWNRDEEGGNRKTIAPAPSALRVTLTARAQIPDNINHTHQ
jgi:hypothetical protein